MPWRWRSSVQRGPAGVETQPMVGHLGLNVPDLAQAKEYYDELMPLLRYQVFLTDETQCAYMPEPGRRGAYLFFYEATDPAPYSRHRPGLQHLAFIVPTRTEVRAGTPGCSRWPVKCCTHPGSSPSTRRPTSQPSGSIPSASCSRPFATTTGTESSSGYTWA